MGSCLRSSVVLWELNLGLHAIRVQVWEDKMVKAVLFEFMKKKWMLALPLSAFMLAFAVRYHFLVTYHYPMMVHEQDAAGYIDVAKRILHFQPLDMGGRAPGYPVVIAFFALFSADLESAARLASIFMDSLIVFPLFALARTCLARTNAFAACLLLPLLGKSSFNRRTFTAPIFFLLGFLLLAIPFLVTFHKQMGYWGVTSKEKTEWALSQYESALNLNSKGELGRTKPGVSVWKEHYKTLPNFISSVRSNIKEYFNVFYNSFPVWMYLVSILGIVYIVWSKWTSSFLYIIILLAVTAPIYIVNITKTNSYLYSVFPALFICFVAGIESVTQGLKWTMSKLWSALQPTVIEAGMGIMLFLLVSYISFGFYQVADASYREPALVEQAMISEKLFKEGGEFMKLNSQKNDVIMTRWGLVGYFADRPVLTLPRGGVKEVLDYGRINGASLIFIDTMTVLSRRQELIELLEPLNGQAVNPKYGIEILNRNYYPDVGGYVIYRYVLKRG